MSNGRPTQQVKKYEPGEYIFREGDTGSEVYIIQSGAVEVVKGLEDSEVVLAALKKGEFFGEMALFGDNKRSASIRAKTPTVLSVISEPVFRSQFKKVPDWFSSIFQVVINRIRQMDAKIITQFKMGIEISILNLLYLLIEKYGKKLDDKKPYIELSVIVNKMKNILGLPPSVIIRNLREFEFIKLIEVDEEFDRIDVTNREMLGEFVDFLQVVSEVDNPEDIVQKLPGLSKEKLSHFLNNFKILTRTKTQSLAI